MKQKLCCDYFAFSRTRLFWSSHVTNTIQKKTTC